MENGANLGFEHRLWAAANKLRSNMDAAEYKHVVLGLIFLKYVSDAFTELHERLEGEGEDAEDPDEYEAEQVFYVPERARWGYLMDNAKSPRIGEVIDRAMADIEKDNKRLRGVLPKIYSDLNIENTKLGELIDEFGKIGFGGNQDKDILGRVYEYFLGEFASAEGKKGGQFYTPRCVVKLLVDMLEPYKGRIFDPCCGSGGMFVQSGRFVEEHSGKIGDISIFGQESNPTTYKLCKMNMAIRRIEATIEQGDTFHNDRHKDLRADFIIANPPFNDSDWNAEQLKDDVRWEFGVPPTGNANFGWVQHFIHHLNQKGMAGFVLANGSMSSNTSNEGEIRRKIIEKDLVSCMVALPSQLFYNTQIPACLWFLSRGKGASNKNRVLFIDARNMGYMVDRKHRELSDEDIKRISDAYHSWLKGGLYEDVAGFCRSVSIDEIGKNDFILTPGRYVGVPEQEEDSEPFDVKMSRLVGDLMGQFKRGGELEREIKGNLKGVGFG